MMMNRPRFFLPVGGLFATCCTAAIMANQFDANDKNTTGDNISQTTMAETGVLENAMDNETFTFHEPDYTIIELRSELEEIKSEIAVIRQNQENFKSIHDEIRVSIGDINNSNDSTLSSPIGSNEYTLQAIEVPIYQQTGEGQYLDEISGLDKIATLDGIMYQQDTDNHWDEQTEGQLRKGFQEINIPDIQLQDIDCHGVICRIEIDSMDEASFLNALEGDIPLIPWNHNGRVATIADSMGSHKTVLYVSREGESLPQGF